MNSALFDALKGRNSEQVKACLRSGNVDVNAREEVSQRTALHVACVLYDGISIKHLLDHGADVNSQDREGNTPLLVLLSEWENHGYNSAILADKMQIIILEIMKLLIVLLLQQAGARVHLRNNDGHSCLHVAAMRGFVIQGWMLGDDLNSPDNLGNTPLHLALSGHNISAARRLVEAGARVHVSNAQRQTPLHLAASIDGCPDLMMILLSRGAEVNVSDDLGRTPLHIAAMSDLVDLVQMLIDHHS